MSERMILEVEVRKELGSKHAAQQRRKGKMPAVIYGHKQEPVAILLDAHDFVEGLHHGHRIFDVNVQGTQETLLVKDLQYDHLGKSVVHADLVRVSMTEMVTVEVGIELKGNAVGTQEGGIVDQHMDTLEVECQVVAIPETIQVSVKELNIGDAIHAGDIELPSGVKLVTEPEAVVVNCHMVTVAKTTEELEEEMPTAPELIGEEKEEGEEGEGESESEAKESSE